MKSKHEPVLEQRFQAWSLTPSLLLPSIVQIPVFLPTQVLASKCVRYTRLEIEAERNSDI